jgi:hypothetical protein
MFALRACATPIENFVSCLAQQPLGHWECDEDGLAAIRDGYCEKEQAAIVACGKETSP